MHSKDDRAYGKKGVGAGSSHLVRLGMQENDHNFKHKFLINIIVNTGCCFDRTRSGLMEVFRVRGCGKWVPEGDGCGGLSWFSFLCISFPQKSNFSCFVSLPPS